MAAIAAAGTSAIVTIPRAVDYAFWQDEVGSARVIVRPGLGSMLHAVVNTENHPPGFYALGWMLSRLAVPVVWDRTISVIAASALSGLVVVYARGLVPLPGAALAGLITALGWQFWGHGWELRPYSLFALACLVFVLALERAAERPTGWRLAFLGGAVAAGSMTHYFFLFTVCGGVLWVFLRKEHAARLLLSMGLGLIPLLVWLPALYKQIDHGAFQTNPDFRVRSAIDVYGALLVRGEVDLPLAVALLALVLLGALRLSRHSETGRLCALSAIVPVAITLAVWLAGPDIYVVKNLVGAAPFAAVAIPAALYALPRPLPIAAVLSAAALVIAGYLDKDGRVVPPYDRVATVLVHEGWHEQDPILLFGPPYQFLHPLDWYLPGRDRLELARWNGKPCTRVFVISVGGHGRALLAGVATVRVRHVVIGRVAYRRDLAREARKRDGHLLAARAARCARGA